MMKPFAEQSVRNELAARIENLSPGSKAKWGKMHVDQMMKHLSELIELANGTRVLPSSKMMRFISLFVGRLIRNRLINNDKPLPKNLGKAPLPLSRGFAEEKENLLHLLLLFNSEHHHPKPLPLFGALSSKEWDVFLMKQFEHHLNQFGV